MTAVQLLVLCSPLSPSELLHKFDGSVATGRTGDQCRIFALVAEAVYDCPWHLHRRSTAGIIFICSQGLQ